MVAEDHEADMVPIIGLGDFPVHFGERLPVRPLGPVVRIDVFPTAMLVINTARECLALEVRINFELITVDVTRRNLFGLAVRFVTHRLVRVSAAELQSGVHPRVSLEIHFEDEIAVLSLGA